MWLESLMLSSVEMLPYMSFGSHLLSLSDGGIWLPQQQQTSSPSLLQRYAQHQYSFHALGMP